MVQIDLHSFDDEYLKCFTKASNTVEKIKGLIKKLADNGVTLRIATIVTPKNVDKLEKIADWVHSNGIKSFAPSPIINIGRAKNNNVLLHDKESINKFSNAIKSIRSKYKNFIMMPKDLSLHRENCGALTTNVTIAPNGQIKICPIDNGQDLSNGLGNVFKENIKDIYDNNIEYLDAVFNMMPPKDSIVECNDCSNKFFCSGCMLRGLIKRKEIGDGCKWYINQVPELIKNTLLI